MDSSWFLFGNHWLRIEAALLGGGRRFADAAQTREREQGDKGGQQPSERSRRMTLLQGTAEAALSWEAGWNLAERERAAGTCG